MKNEKISYQIKFKAHGNAFKPNDLTIDNLTELKILKDSKEITVSHPGELVAYFKLKNGSTLKANRNEISVSTDSLEKSLAYLNSLKSIYSESRIKSIEIEIDEHFIDSAFPKLVFDKFKSVKGMKLDVFRYKIDESMFVIYNCHPEQMHLKIESTVKFDKSAKCGKIDLEKSLSIKSLLENRTLFIEAFLK